MRAGIAATPSCRTASTLCPRLPPLQAAVQACGRGWLGVSSRRASISISSARSAEAAASSSSSAHSGGEPASAAGAPLGEPAAQGAGLRSYLAAAMRWVPALLFCQLLAQQSAIKAVLTVALLLTMRLAWWLGAAVYRQLAQESALLKCREQPAVAVAAVQRKEVHSRLRRCAVLAFWLCLLALGCAAVASVCPPLGVPEAAHGAVDEMAFAEAAPLLAPLGLLLFNLQEAWWARGIAHAAERIAAASSPA